MIDPRRIQSAVLQPDQKIRIRVRDSMSQRRKLILRRHKGERPDPLGVLSEPHADLVASIRRPDRSQLHLNPSGIALDA